MIIKNLKIENHPGLHDIELSFDKDFNAICGRKSLSVLGAIGTLLKNRPLSEGAEVGKRQAGTIISADIDAGHSVYRVSAQSSKAEGKWIYDAVLKDGKKMATDFYQLVRQCREEQDVSWFSHANANLYPSYFQRYRDTELFYKTGEFFSLTDGTGETRTFRSLLTEFISQFRPERLIPLKEYEIFLDKNGCFTVSNPKHPGQDACLSESDRLLFEYRCFLYINEFWSTVECIRDLHHEWPPVIISGLLEYLDPYVADSGEYMEKTARLGRQVFLAAESPGALDHLHIPPEKAFLVG